MVGDHAFFHTYIQQYIYIYFFYTYIQPWLETQLRNPFMPTAPTFAQNLKPLRDDSTPRALSSLGGLREAPEVSPLCRQTSVSQTANVGTVGKNWLMLIFERRFIYILWAKRSFSSRILGKKTCPKRTNFGKLRN